MPKPRASILLCLLLAVLLLAGGLAWLGRDLPRWAVEGLVADAAGARVELGEVMVPSPRHLVLRRLRIAAIPLLPNGKMDRTRLREIAIKKYEPKSGD